jgi:leucyl-tRNA---protein transferase
MHNMKDSLIYLDPYNQQEVFIDEHFFAQDIQLHDWELMLAYGWRHNGDLVFRNTHDYNEYGETTHVVPMRYRTFDFQMSKSQHKIWKQNLDLAYRVMPTQITPRMVEIFEQHRTRFKYRRPETIWEFVNLQAPFPTYQLELYKKTQLLATTFIDLTPNALSSTYAMFDLNESKRSLGTFTMILEIYVAKLLKKQFHYPGYAHREPSHMDYKKRFAAAEYLHWETMTWNNNII